MLGKKQILVRGLETNQYVHLGNQPAAMSVFHVQRFGTMSTSLGTPSRSAKKHPVSQLEKESHAVPLQLKQKEILLEQAVN